MKTAFEKFNELNNDQIDRFHQQILLGRDPEIVIKEIEEDDSLADIRSRVSS